MRAADHLELCNCIKGCALVAEADLRTSAALEANDTFAFPSLEPSPGQRAESASSGYLYQVLGAMPASGMTTA